MTKVQIEQTSKITEFARNMVKQSNYPEDLQDHIIATCMVVVTEATKELKDNFKIAKDNEYEYSSLLTKAKRYIKELLRAVESSYSVLSWQRPPIKAEAEQFLNENSTDERIQKAKYNYTD